MRNAVFGLALVSALAMGTSAYAGSPSVEQSMVQPVYYGDGYGNGYGCGPHCQWRRHERWEARREWHHRRWEERHYGYYAYPRY
jgi:hypothetical protein